MSFAVIKTGGKQYLVEEKSKIKIEKLAVEEGAKVTFSEVLLAADEKGNVNLGTPFLKDVSVEATVIVQTKAKKVTGVHYKPKTRNKKKFGHRQNFTEVEIVSLSI